MSLPKTLFVACMMALFCSSKAELTFQTTKITHEATFEEKEFVANFAFTNSGDRTVTIAKVHSSCGCTVATPTASVLEPGEGGTISATFTFGSRVGHQSKLVEVFIEGRQAPYSLLIEVYIPEALKASKPLHRWKIGQKPEAFTTRITRASADVGVQWPDAYPETFDVSVSPVDDLNWDMTLTPKATQKQGTTYLDITALLPNGDTRRLRLYLLIR